VFAYLQGNPATHERLPKLTLITAGSLYAL
jgi:hypothetical protein